MTFIQYLCSSLQIEQPQLLSFLASAPKRYKKYEIPKRNGKGNRLIAHPSKGLKALQRASLPVIRDKLKVHEAAMAYEKGTGIRRNAIVHRTNRYLLKMDFSNFFSSIKPNVLIDCLESVDGIISELDQFAFSCLFFWSPTRGSDLELSIGAPSSPFISNAVLYDFDEYITMYCRENGIVYTRYADDLTFSTNAKGTLFLVPDMVKKLIKGKSFNYLRVNEDKTVFLSKSCNRHITGITISNDDELSLGRNRKRLISSKIHYYLNGKLEREEINQLKGLLGFAKYVEPSFIDKMKSKYGEKNILAIQKYNLDCKIDDFKNSDE